MNVGRAFSFVFQDPLWFRKLAAAGGLLLVPVVGWLLVFGYWLRVVRGVVRGTDVPLPAWNAWTELLADGLKAATVAFAWSLLPTVLFLVPNVAEGTGSGWLLLAGLLLNLAVVLITPAALARVAVGRSLLGGIEGGAVVRTIARNIRDYLVVFLLTVAITLAFGIAIAGVALVGVAAVAVTDSGAVGVLGAALVGLAALLAIPYHQLVLYHLYGQAYYRAEPTAWRQPGALN